MDFEFKILNYLFSEFYEETFSLVYDLTSKTVSPDMWQMLELIYQVSVLFEDSYWFRVLQFLFHCFQVFKKDGYDYFVDMMPALHNYVTVDTPAFLSNQNHVLAIFDMCKSVWQFVVTIYILF